MSSTLALAKLLQHRSATELEAILSQLRSATNSLTDLFDLAKLLLSKRELERKIRSLDSAALEDLKASRASDQLKNQLLADSSVFPEASELAKSLKPMRKPEFEDFGGSLALIETLMSLTELLYALEQHWFETTKSGIRSNDAKPIAEKFHTPAKRMQQRFQLAMAADLVQEHGGRWAVSPSGREWLAMDRESAWQKLAEAIWDLPDGEYSVGEITAQIEENFPLLDQSSLNFLRFAQHLGLMQRDELKVAVGTEPLAKIAAKMISQLPQDEDRIIVQSDLSIICTGPISPALHGALDSFAISEELGLASRFRLSQLSISHFLETGGTIAEVAAALEQFSNKELPQPVRYLLVDAERKFGQLKIHAGRPTLISSTDPILLTQLANEKSLAHLALQTTEEGLCTNAGVELTYFSLRSCSYAAIMVGEGGVISPRMDQVSTQPISPERQLSALAKQLIDSESATGETSEVRRVLQFALKNRLEITVEFEDQAGALETVKLIPLGLTDSRLRGRETVREAERTLPVARIKSATLD